MVAVLLATDPILFPPVFPIIHRQLLDTCFPDTGELSLVRCVSALYTPVYPILLTISSNVWEQAEVNVPV